MSRRSHTLSRILLLMASMVILLGLRGANAVPVPGKITQRGNTDLAQYVNPLIGTSPGGSNFGFTGNSGDTFPGAAYPLGMVQWSPDTTSNLPGGYYYPDDTIKGLSLTHFSGRGCTAYQDIPFMPYVGTVHASPALSSTSYSTTFSHTSEQAQPGYYKVHLDGPDVTAELSAGQRIGMGRFTYPASSEATMLINAGGSINGNSDSGVAIVGNTMVTGFATSRVGCGHQHYTLYFAAQFDHTFTHVGTWNEGLVNPGSHSTAGIHSGVFVTFGTRVKRVLHVQVGISFVSLANAQANLAAEHPHFDFDSVRTQAYTAWNQRLTTIRVQGGTEEEKRVFYTALYHVFFHPNCFSDANGQYIGFDGRVHRVSEKHIHFENIPGWDEYRSLIRLRAILAPAETSDIAQSLVDDAIQGDGHLPRWEQGNADSQGMNGDDGAVMVEEAYTFGAADFHTAAALAAMLNGQAKVREGLDDYLTLGYVAASTTRNSAAITQEYANDDFAIAQFAKALGNIAGYKTLLHRSGNWQNVFNTASGYIQPRNKDGTWAAHFSPTSEYGFQEGDSAQYTWMETFDLHDLFSKMGGNAAVTSRLDRFFSKLNEGPESPYAFMGNEPCFEVPWEYDFAQAPSHTQRVVRQIQLQLFNNTPAGLPGNDDGGALSSWYVFSAIGLYPEITGVAGFVVGSPLFTSVTVQLAGGQTLQINAPAAADSHPYVQGLSLNSNATTSLWLPWSSVQHGATLDFMLSDHPTSWGSSIGDEPPSFAP